MRLPLSSFKWIPVFLVLLGYIAVVPNAKGSIECGTEMFSPIDCPPILSAEEETNNNTGRHEGNIEEQIPSVIPFP